MIEVRLTKEHLKQLAAPFGPEAIKIKVQTKPNDNGNALCVAYIDARDVMDRLDEVAGGDWWDDYRKAESGGLECALTVLGVTRKDVGADDNTNETEKSAYSDALKRAAVKFGIGRFLYGLPKMYAKVRPVGKNFYLVDGEEERLSKIIQAALNGHSNGHKPASKPAPAIEYPPELSVVTTHDGKLYIELPDSKLKFMATEIRKALNRPDITEDQKATYSMKADVIKQIQAIRAN